jgi:hypothetical protein
MVYTVFYRFALSITPAVSASAAANLAAGAQALCFRSKLRSSRMNALTVVPGAAVAVAPQCSHLNAAELTRTVFHGAICTALSVQLATRR